MNLAYILNHEPSLNLGRYFDDAQKHKNDHPAIISSMYKLSRKANVDTFTLEFLQCLSSALVQKEKSPYAIIALEFAAKFCCHHAKNIPEDVKDLFLEYIVEFVTKVGDCKQTVVRLRVCEFINLLLSSMATDATIAEEIFEMLTQCILDRAKDKLPTVRVRAFAALQRLQDPQDNNCLVTKAFLFHLECDPSAEVRKQILKNIAITQHTLPAIITRSRDFSEVVRKEMYQTISKIKTKRLRIRHRQELLTNGLNDSSEVVRDHVTKKLIPTWFEESERDYLKLLELFLVETYSLETVSTLLISLFKRRASADLLDIVTSWQNKDKVIPLDELTTEKSLMWLLVVKYFCNPPSYVKIDKEDVVSILPGLTLFTNYLKEFFKTFIKNDIKLEYIFLRLLELVFHFSLTDDEKGRMEVKELCRELLLSKNVESEELVKLLSRLITLVEPDVLDRLEMITLIISDIQHPLEENDKFDDNSDLIESSTLESSLGLEHLRINNTVASNNMDDVEFSDVNMLPKCLLMLIETLKAKDLDSLYPVLDTLHRTFLINCFKLDISYVSSLAISALSLLCLKSYTFAKTKFITFLLSLETDSLELSSLEAIFDQVLFYGCDICLLSVDKSNDAVQISKNKNAPSLDFYDDPTISTISMKHLLNRLSSYLFSPVVQIRSVTCQGLAKLLLTSRINSSFVLAKLVIVWFSPELGSDPCVSQPLGIFFDIFSKKVLNSGEIILNALIPALDHLTSKDCDPNFATVDPLRVANLLLSTLNNAPPPDKGGSYHCQTANLICDELLSRDIRSEAQMFITLTKCLYHLHLRKSDKQFACDLLDKLPVVLNKVEKLKEKSVKKIAIGFFSKLNGLWGIKITNDTSSVSANQFKKENVSIEDDAHMKSEYGNDQMDDTNVTVRKSRNSRFTSCEPIIEEFSGSEDECNGAIENGRIDQPVQNGVSDQSPEDSIDSGTTESEDSDSDEQNTPPTRRKQRRLLF